MSIVGKDAFIRWLPEKKKVRSLTSISFPDIPVRPVKGRPGPTILGGDTVRQKIVSKGTNPKRQIDDIDT